MPRDRRQLVVSPVVDLSCASYSVNVKQSSALSQIQRLLSLQFQAIQRGLQTMSVSEMQEYQARDEAIQQLLTTLVQQG